ncbi:MAG: Transcriptional regulator, GntR family [Anaerolineae bacterium]|nr:MAG: Transcriptional regulator, GntR family [Anaerolineae bacterium]
MLRPGPLPKHYQLSQILRQRILKGEFPAGTKIPGEWQLSQEFNVSRGTVRKAIDTLLHEGLLRTEQGQGTYVVEDPWRSRPFLLLSNFNDHINRQNQTPRTTVLEKVILPASTQVAHRLLLVKGEEVILISRLRWANGQPVVYEQRYLAKRICPQLVQEDLENQSFHELLVKKYRLPLVRVLHSIEAHVLTEEEANLLQTQAGRAAFYIERLTYTILEGKEHPAVWYLAIHLGNEYAFHIQQIFGKGESEPVLTAIPYNGGELSTN